MQSVDVEFVTYDSIGCLTYNSHRLIPWNHRSIYAYPQVVSERGLLKKTVAMQKPQILIVDDDSKLTGLVRVILERVGGFKVREENRSYAAVETARSYQPDLILLDVNMPGKDGGDVASELKADPVLNKTPIVFLTSLVDKNGLNGGIRFISKPFEPQELIRTVNRMLPCVVAG